MSHALGPEIVVDELSEENQQKHSATPEVAKMPPFGKASGGISAGHACTRQEGETDNIGQVVSVESLLAAAPQSQPLLK
jgi:hypothetical protein